MTAHVLLVRHGEPTDDDRCHGSRSDPGLSRRGQRQAAALPLRVRLLAAELGPVRRIRTSPAARAVATAVPLVQDLDRQPVVDDRWRERDWGDWEGRPWEQLWRTAPPEATADTESYLAWTPPGGEPLDDVTTRVGAAVREALEQDGTTVVVTHAGAIRAALSTVLDLSAAATFRLAVEHARIAALATDGDAVTLARLGA